MVISFARVERAQDFGFETAVTLAEAFLESRAH